MKYRIFALIGIIGLLAGLIGPAPAAVIKLDGTRAMPPNPEKIAAALIARGELPAGASVAEKEAAVQAYLQKKLKGGMDREANPLARQKVEAAEESLNLVPSDLRGKKLGKTVQVDPSNPQFKPLEGTDKLLLILVEFNDTPYTWTPTNQEPRTAAGPLHNQIPLPDNDFDLWLDDFSTQHYEDMLFTPGGWEFPEDHPFYSGEHRGSMHDFYLEQSYGKYTVDGQAYGWFKLDKPEAYYGDDNPAGGNDNLAPGNPRTLISDSIQEINAQNAIDWLEYDVLDLYDLDSDGDVNEPDCIIDHPLFIHSGIDQSGGGGAQGDDAIWAHSSATGVSLNYFVSDAKNPGATCPAGWPGTLLYNYTIMPEDGGVGVFAHEFGHDLGLPDEYDTIYSGGNNTGFWSLMSSGSWIGRPAQTQPSGISPWGKMVLGWLKPGDNLAVTDIKSLTKDPTAVRLEQVERWGGEGKYNALRVNLPNKVLHLPPSGSWEWFGGQGNSLDNKLLRTVDLTGKTSAALSFSTWYDIEPYWDFVFVQVSTDGGVTWVSLPIDGTTSDHDPEAQEDIVANLPGFTGSSGGTLYKTVDLSAYAGQVIQLRFRYMTDAYTYMAGFYLDDIQVTADGNVLFLDNVETPDPAWTAAGWTRNEGGLVSFHYYLMEWRNLAPLETPYGDASIVNFDNGLSNAYQFDAYGSKPNQPLYFSYNPGLLVWYRDGAYAEGDNWTGVHPGAGFLLPVDAHPNPLVTPPIPGTGHLLWNTRVQTYDSAFSLNRAGDITLNLYDVSKTYQGESAVPNFDDKWSYWTPQHPYNSVLTPPYGLVFRVAGQASDGSAVVIGVGKK
jgi:immune inhibitor A